MAKFITAIIVLLFSCIHVACDMGLNPGIMTADTGVDSQFSDTEVMVWEETNELPVAEVKECPTYDFQGEEFTSWIDGDVEQPIFINNTNHTLSQDGFLSVKDDCGQGYVVRAIHIWIEVRKLPPENAQLTMRVGQKVVTETCKSIFQGGGPNRHYIHCGYETTVDVTVRPGEVVDFFYKIEGVLLPSDIMWSQYNTVFSLEDMETGDPNIFFPGAPEEFIWVEE